MTLTIIFGAQTLAGTTVAFVALSLISRCGAQTQRIFRRDMVVTTSIRAAMTGFTFACLSVTVVLYLIQT